MARARGRGSEGVVAAAPVSLRRQLRLTLMAAAAALLVVVVAAVYALTQVITLQGRVTGFYYDAIAHSDELYGWLEDASTALDSYVAVGYEPGLAPVQAPLQDETQRVRELLVADAGADARSVEALDAAVAAGRAWHDEYALPVLALAPVDGRVTVPAALDRLGSSLYSTARSEADAFTQVLRIERDLAAEELSSWTRNLFLTVVLLTVAALGAGLGVWFTLRRRILEPLADLAAKAEAVSDGSLDQAVRTRAPGEIAALAHAVDAMRVALVDQMAAASSSREEIAEAHRQVSEQAEELRRSNRDLEQFAYVASHDLQEPLRKVASFTQLLQKRYGGELDERADQYIEFAVDGAKRMQRLIQDLLGFSRVGRALDEPQPVDLGQALQAALANLELPAEGAEVRIETADLPTVMGQQSLLVQLFQNLVGNAVKFRSPDRAPVVEVGAVRCEAGWELWCRDNGIGVDAQYADRVFVIFQRLHPKDVYAGTGIGLALCKKIVEFHGGEIWVDVTPRDPGVDGPGTTVRWTLPDPDPALGGAIAGPLGAAPADGQATGAAVPVPLSSTTDAAASDDGAVQPIAAVVENLEESQ